MTGDTFNRPPELGDQPHGEPVVNAPDGPHLRAVLSIGRSWRAHGLYVLPYQGRWLLDPAGDDAESEPEAFDSREVAEDAACWHIANDIRRDAATDTPDDKMVLTFTVTDENGRMTASAAVEHDHHRGVWTAEVNVKRRFTTVVQDALEGLSVVSGHLFKAAPAAHRGHLTPDPQACYSAALAHALTALAERGLTTSNPAALLVLAENRCSRVAGVYDALTHALGCTHLPALPAQIDSVKDWGAVAQIERAATSIASAVEKSRRNQCACDVAATSEPIRDLWIALAETLSVIKNTVAGDPATTDGLSRSLGGLTRRLEAVETTTAALLKRIATAKTAAEASTALIKRVFDRIADAGCAHSPAAVTNEPLRGDAAAIEQHERLSRRIRAAIELAVYHEADEHGRSQPSECCDALTTKTSVALFTVADWWACTLEAARQFVIHGEATDETRIAETTRELQAAIDDMFE